MLSDVMSQSPQTGQFNSYAQGWTYGTRADGSKSQSHQTGQFNSYATSRDLELRV